MFQILRVPHQPKPYSIVLVAAIFIASSLITAVSRAAGSEGAVSDRNGEEQQDANLNDEPPLIKVIKINKKNQAVVVFSKRKAPLKKGQKWRLVKKLPVEGDNEGFETASRSRFIGLSGNLSMLETKSDNAGAKTKSDVIDLSLLYGWNKETIEYGLLAEYSFTKLEKTDSRKIELGVLFDYNFTPNSVDVDSVVALRVIAAYGQLDDSSYQKAASTIRVEPALIYKWFGLSPNLAATLGVGYRYQNVSLGDTKSTTSGVVSRIGIQAYF